VTRTNLTQNRRRARTVALIAAAAGLALTVLVMPSSQGTEHDHEENNAMAGTPRIATFPEKIKDLEKRVRIMERSSRLTSASISKGNLTIRDGGNLVIEDGGSLIVRDSAGGSSSINANALTQRTLTETTHSDMTLSNGGTADLNWTGPEWAERGSIMVVAVVTSNDATGVPPFTGRYDFVLSVDGTPVTSPRGWAPGEPGITSVVLTKTVDFAGAAGFSGDLTTDIGAAFRVQMATTLTWETEKVE